MSSVAHLVLTFLFLSTGGRYKAGEQPYAGTRFICTEIYQNTCSETQLFNRDVHRPRWPSRRNTTFIHHTSEASGPSQSPTTSAGGHRLSNGCGPRYWKTDSDHKWSRWGFLVKLRKTAKVWFQRTAPDQSRRRLGHSVVECCSGHAPDRHRPAIILCNLFQNKR